jgi:hypothetical protein
VNLHRDLECANKRSANNRIKHVNVPAPALKENYCIEGWRKLFRRMSAQVARIILEIILMLITIGTRGQIHQEYTYERKRVHAPALKT